MHELSIAQSLIDVACEAAERDAAQRVNKLRLRIGNMSGVVAEALRFSFDLAAEGTACEGAVLEIEEVGVVVHCPKCKAPKRLAVAYGFVCPTCGNPMSEILAGRELELVSLEVDAHATACA